MDSFSTCFEGSSPEIYFQLDKEMSREAQEWENRSVFENRNGFRTFARYFARYHPLVKTFIDAQLTHTEYIALQIMTLCSEGSFRELELRQKTDKGLSQTTLSQTVSSCLILSRASVESAYPTSTSTTLRSSEWTTTRNDSGPFWAYNR